jgi:phosphonate transport system substrate-binding protein
MVRLRASARPLLVITLLALAGAAGAATGAPGHPRPLVLALIPQSPPVAMHERWTPFVDRLASLAGVPIELKLYEDMQAFERDYAAGVPDLLFAHPVMSVEAHLRQGYQPLVRDQTLLAGVLFVRKDSPFRSLSDLEGKRIAFVGARSFCAIITKGLMSREKTAQNFQAQNTGSTRNVLKAVVLGKADAGASLDVALDAEPAELRDQLRPLATTRGMAPHPLSAHPRVDGALRRRIVEAVLAMRASPADLALLASVRLTDPVEADYARDYRLLEEELPHRAAGR